MNIGAGFALPVLFDAALVTSGLVGKDLNTCVAQSADHASPVLSHLVSHDPAKGDVIVSMAQSADHASPVLFDRLCDNFNQDEAAFELGTFTQVPFDQLQRGQRDFVDDAEAIPGLASHASPVPLDAAL
eukprot:8631306-Karenia_brevis.AAC.1